MPVIGKCHTCLEIDILYFVLHRKKNESCVTQANTGYLEKAKFILARIDPSEINTVYCVYNSVTASC